MRAIPNASVHLQLLEKKGRAVTAKPKSFLITLYLCGLFISGGCQTTHPAQVGTASADGSQRRPVRVDWHAELVSIQKQLERDPNSSFLHGQAAIAYDNLDDFERFDHEIQTAIKLDSTNSMPRYMAYAVYKRRQLKDKQGLVLDAALKVDPSNPFGHYEKAGMFEDAREWQSALKEYEATAALLERVKSDPSNFQKNSWRYVDPRGNPFDLTVQESRISDDIARVRDAIEKRK